MTKTELRDWQRRFEWSVPRDRDLEQRVRRHKHDLFDQVQVIELATELLRTRLAAADGESTPGPSANELLDDVRRAVEDLKGSGQRLVTPAGSEVATPCAPVIERAIERVRGLAEVHAAIDARASVGLTADELEHLVVSMVLTRENVPVELVARERSIEGTAWVEILCCAGPAPIDEHELMIVEAIVTRDGGELSRSERRDGGEEIVVALRAKS